MIDPWLGLAALSLTLAESPGMPDRDPGSSPACPADMRLVAGDHYENMGHLCLDPRKDTKDTHCYRYADDLSLLEGPVTTIHVCMDQFEAPNRRGAEPLVMQSYNSATRWCERRGKRMCTEREWELGCEGPHHLPLAYGWAVNVKLCNSNKRWRPVNFEAYGKTREEAQEETKRLWQGSVSGRYQTCVSPFGIYDMMGNVEEWVTSRKSRKWPGSLMGGFWAKPWTGCRGTNDAHRPHFAFYETGFRCCKDPKAPAAPEG
ncbi:MAG: SUMF1/EgtB/PvdO family nonheme iron enzyme [Deltaproteobacteria bacterium]|nr:SUMF1/EgtB/PvdO family nonheme iron enzyme [Deltaproteobacteria bacterium]